MTFFWISDAATYESFDLTFDFKIFISYLINFWFYGVTCNF